MTEASPTMDAERIALDPPTRRPAASRGWDGRLVVRIPDTEVSS
jgi:hypothetical protein